MGRSGNLDKYVTDGCLSIDGWRDILSVVKPQIYYFWDVLHLSFPHIQFMRCAVHLKQLHLFTINP